MLRALVIALLLAGCGFQYSKEAWHDKKCREYGAKPGTDAYVQCRASLEAGTLAGRKP